MSGNGSLGKMWPLSQKFLTVIERLIAFRRIEIENKKEFFFKCQIELARTGCV